MWIQLVCRPRLSAMLYYFFLESGPRLKVANYVDHTSYNFSAFEKSLVDSMIRKFGSVWAGVALAILVYTTTMNLLATTTSSSSYSSS